MKEIPHRRSDFTRRRRISLAKQISQIPQGIYFVEKKPLLSWQTKAVSFLVPVTGFEPVRCRHRGILSPLRLPIPPHRLIQWQDRVYHKKGRKSMTRRGGNLFSSYFSGKFPNSRIQAAHTCFPWKETRWSMLWQNMQQGSYFFKTMFSPSIKISRESRSLM